MKLPEGGEGETPRVVEELFGDGVTAGGLVVMRQPNALERVGERLLRVDAEIGLDSVGRVEMEGNSGRFVVDEELGNRRVDALCINGGQGDDKIATNSGHKQRVQILPISGLFLRKKLPVLLLISRQHRAHAHFHLVSILLRRH